MKKIIVLISILGLMVVPSYGQSHSKIKYKGNAEMLLGYGAGTYSDNGKFMMGIQTTHGVNWNDYFFTGVGFGYQSSVGNGDYEVPLYFRMRFNILNGQKKHIPYIETDIGYSFCNSGNITYGISLGYRLKMGNKIKGLSFSLGYNGRMIGERINETHPVYYVLQDRFNIRIGFDF